MGMTEQRGGTARNILIWTYERGTLQYDILCGLILAFIFFVPRSFFAAEPAGNTTLSQPAIGAGAATTPSPSAPGPRE